VVGADGQVIYADPMGAFSTGSKLDLAKAPGRCRFDPYKAQTHRHHLARRYQKKLFKLCELNSLVFNFGGPETSYFIRSLLRGSSVFSFILIVR
jgi:hypothetical protein